MKILSLSLIGNKRLLYSGTREIHYTPESSIQLIIGNNGSGKSTLLNELSPLPGLKGEYEKGGSKTIELYSRGFYYRLVSTFDKDQKHYFIRATTRDELCAENNLNDGHTLTIQKQLVEEHFRYTSEIHDLLLGNVRLTLLTPQKRKEWFVKLCDVDVTYAVGVYQRLLTNARNTLGARKHTEQKLMDERSRLLTEEELDELQQQINGFTRLSRQYSEAKTPTGTLNHRELESLETVVQDKLVAIQALSNELIDLCELDLCGAMSVGELREYLESSRDELGRSEERLHSLKREYESIFELVSLVSSDDGRSIEDLRNEVIELESRMSAFEVDVSLVQREDLKGVFNDASTIADALDDLLLKMPSNKDYELHNRDTVTAAEEELQRLTQIIDKALFAIQSRERRIDELSRHKPTECPNCNHVWIPGVSENEIVRLQSEVERLNSKLPEYETLRVKVREYLEQANEWKEQYGRYSAYVREYPRLGLLWETFSTDKRILNRPSSLVGEVRKLLHRITTAIDLRALMDRRDLLHSAITQREQVEGDKGKVLTQRAEYLEKEMGTTQKELEYYRKTYRELKDTHDQVITIGDKKTLLQNLLEDVSKALIRKDQHVKNTLLDGEIEELMLTLAGLSKRLNDALGKTQVVEHLERNLEELSIAEADFKLLLQSLSPTEGLIADSLMGFINTVTDQMNYIIKQIWSTNLKVLPCHAERGDLDYKFPLSFGGDTPVGDVSLGSKGQKELVDYVFVLIAMIYLDLKDYPLLMDEVGHSFHDVHRIRLFDYIKKLLEQGTVGQVFVVSHFSNTHGSLTHADVNVIDNTGVLVPVHANKRLLIK